MNAPAINPLLRQQLIVLACMYMGYGGMMICRQTVPILSAAMITDPTLGLSKSDYGAIIGLGAAGALVGKLLWGPLSDLLGGRITFLLGLVFSALLIAAFGLAPGAALFPLLVIALYGAKSAGWPAMAKLIGNWYPSRAYGRVWGVLSTSSRTSVITGTLVLGALLAFLPWRTVAVISGLFGLALAVLCWRFMYNSPADSGLDEPLNSSVQNHSDGAVDGPRGEDNLKQALRHFFRSRQVWLIFAVLMTLTVLMEFLSFVPIYLVENFAVDASQAAVASSVLPMGSLVAVLLGGWAYDKLSRKHLRPFMSLLLCVTVACLAALMLLPDFSLPGDQAFYVALLLIFLFGASISPAYYLPMSVFAIEFGGLHSGVLICLIDASGFFAAMIYAPVAGHLAESSWHYFMLLLLVVAIAAVVLTWLFLDGEYRRTGKRDFV